MGLVCGIDTETTGLDYEKDTIIEIAAVTFDDVTWKPLHVFQRFVCTPGLPPLSPLIKELTRITDDMLMDGDYFEEVLSDFKLFSKDCTHFIAHNAEFDKKMLEGMCKKHSLYMPEKEWICSKTDIKTHFGKRCTKLSHLALDYGLAVDGSTLHRATEDVLLMGQVLAKSGMTLGDILKWKKEPWIYIQAIVEKPWLDNGASTTLAKADGYTWEKCHGDTSTVFSKQWIKRVKESEYENEIKKEVGFKRTRAYG